MRGLTLGLVLVWAHFTNCLVSQPSSLFSRASTCPDPSFTECSQAGLPSEFCCSGDSSCLVLAGNTTVLCCPTGENCQEIKSITCDITQQNVTLHPSNLLKTTALTSQLPTCGDSCCPFGYTCNADGNCDLESDQSFVPAGASPSNTAAFPTATTSTGAPSSTFSFSSASPTASGEPSTSITPVDSTKSCSKFPTPAILVGFFPGLVLGIVLGVVMMCMSGGRKQEPTLHPNPSSSSSFGFGPISEPRIQSSSDARTDFLRKPARSLSSSTITGSVVRRNPTVQRVRSMFRKSSTADLYGVPQGQVENEVIMDTSTPSVPPLKLNRPPMAMRSEVVRPMTPVLQREPSYGEIDIFADGDTASSLRKASNPVATTMPAAATSPPYVSLPRPKPSSNGSPTPLGNRLGLGLKVPVGAARDRASHQTTFTDILESSRSNSETSVPATATSKGTKAPPMGQGGLDMGQF